MESDSEDGQTPNSAGLDPLVEGRAPDGSLPQGEPVLAAPKDQVLDDPRDHGGIIIPTSNTGIYLPGEKVALSVKSGKKNGSLTPNQNGAFPMMVIVPNGKAELKLTYADLPVGTKIDLFCADGGHHQWRVQAFHRARCRRKRYRDVAGKQEPRLSLRHLHLPDQW